MAQKLNLQRGLRRLTWAVGILLAVFFALLEVSKPTLRFGGAWWAELLFVLFLLGLGIGIAWALYGLARFVIRGFRQQEPRSVARRR